MEMRQVVTGALAWAGLVVVVAVPSAEAVLSRLTRPTAIAHVQPDDVAVAPAPSAPQLSSAAGAGTAPAIRQAAITKPVGTPALKIVAATTAAADAVEPVEIGSTPAARVERAPPETAPPAPESAAARPALGAAAGETMAAVKGDSVAVATGEADGAGLTDGFDSPPARPPVPVPMPAADRPKPPPARVVTADELGGWKSGSLADFLRQRNFANPAASASDSQN